MLMAVLAQFAGAQSSDTARSAIGTTVSGVVRDSIARAPLAGAMVELVAADNPSRFARTAVSDAQGRYMLKDVPDGHHMLGFFHPLLDSIGVDAPLRDVFVAESRPVYADLAVPSPRRIRTAICGESAVDSGAVIVGVVRNARDGSPAAGATVVGEWVEISLRRNGFVNRRVPRRVAKTGDNGWFAMCNVPNAGTIAMIASRGADSTGLIEVRAPVDGFLRRELYLGSAPSGTNTVSRQPGDITTQALRRARTGDGRVSGTVVTSADGTPLAGALVSINDGPETRANERGEWTLSDAPLGTRMLEVRALGYYPERRRVDVIPGAPSVHVALSTLKAVLDTVRVVASRINNRDGDGFERRHKTGIGRYVTQADLARWNPVTLSDIFRQLPGVQLDYDTTGVEKQVLMRGAFGKCAPAVYINGLVMTSRTADGGDAISMTADDLDTWIRPGDVIGIEVYAGDTAPIEYQQGMSGCGSILIWTKLGR